MANIFAFVHCRRVANLTCLELAQWIFVIAYDQNIKLSRSIRYDAILEYVLPKGYECLQWEKMVRCITFLVVKAI